MRRAADGVEIDVFSQVVQRLCLAGAEQLGYQGYIDPSAFMEGEREGILRGVDFMSNGGLDDALGEDRTRRADVVRLVIGFDRGDQPDIGVVEEGLKIGAPLIFLLGSRVRVGTDRGDGAVDRAVLLDEGPVVREQPLLQDGVGFVV